MFFLSPVFLLDCFISYGGEHVASHVMDTLLLNPFPPGGYSPIIISYMGM